MNYCAVIDTNVLVSSVLSSKDDAATVRVMNYVLEGKIRLLYNDDIIDEYRNVLSRRKFSFSEQFITRLIERMRTKGIKCDATLSDEFFPDESDRVFYEVALSKKDSFLVTGNLKHFPQKPIVVTPAAMLKIVEEKHRIEH